jgi:putative spermidine/putrescine transport system ATP-binding protein
MREGEVRQVGTPEDLFSRPDHIDVAEFMGFRNRLAGRVLSVAGDQAVIDVGGARVAGRVREPVTEGAAASVAVRPEDLHPIANGADGTLNAEIASMEFRGREFIGFGRTAGGADLIFRSPHRLEPGITVSLGAEPDRVLVFAGDAR